MYSQLSTRSSGATLSKWRWNFLCRALEVAGDGSGTSVGVDEEGATVGAAAARRLRTDTDTAISHWG